MQDRYAEGRFLPPIDDSQDWTLEYGEQENGYTVLEFSRNLTTCDPRDLDIKVRYVTTHVLLKVPLPYLVLQHIIIYCLCYMTQEETARVVWSYHYQDPANSDPSLVLQHSHQGSRSLNLLGGLREVPEEPADAQSFIIQNHNVSVVVDVWKANSLCAN